MLFWVLLGVGAVVLVNGWTDAPGTISSPVSAGVLSRWQGVLLAAVGNALGLLVWLALSPAVADTVRLSVRLPAGRQASLAVLLCALVSAALWAVGGWWMGLPTSESHALMAGLAGGAMAVGGAGCVSAAAWLRVGAGLIGSLLGGYLTGRSASRTIGDAARPGMEKALVAGAWVMSFLHGAQDGQKLVGLWLLAVSFGGGEGELTRVAWVCALLLAIGSLFGGGRILDTLESGFGRVDIAIGCSADAGAAASLFLLTLLGLPVSTTHTKTAAILGATAKNRRDRGRWATARKMLWATALTFPACFGMGYGGMRLFMLFL